MGFSNDVLEERFERQGKKCAGCRKLLVWENRDGGEKGAWEAHHMDGNAENNEMSNCACVCPNCHLEFAHNGDFVNGNLAPKSLFTLN